MKRILKTLHMIVIATHVILTGLVTAIMLLPTALYLWSWDAYMIQLNNTIEGLLKKIGKRGF